MSTALVRARAAFPALRDASTLARSLKCELVAARLEDREVVVKVLDHSDPIWRWYFEREVAVLASEPPGAPALIAADHDASMLVCERAPGTPASRGRRIDEASLPADDVVRRIIDALSAIASWTPPTVAPPPAAIRRAMRARLLEDPSAPRGWILEGLERAARLDILEPVVAAACRRAIEASGTRPQHGDALPRNIVLGDNSVALVDWECAGEHATGWDRALLWASLPPAGRAILERAVSATATDAERAAFFALAVFALAREVKFARRSPARERRLRQDLALAAGRVSSSA